MELDELILSRFDGIDEDLCLRTTMEFEEKRPSPCMLCVGVGSERVVNPGLPDFEIIVDVILDVLILDDENGEKFKELKKKVTSKVVDMADRFTPINDRFPEDASIVGCFLDDCGYALEKASNRCTWRLRIITSEND